MELLAGDVGGTKTRLAVFVHTNGHLKLHFQKEFRSAEAASLSELVREAIRLSGASPVAACFGVPGPVIQGRVKVTNLPWELDEAVLAKELGISCVRLVNDLVSYTSSIPLLGEQELEVIHPGKRSETDNRSVVVAPGTGLGVGFLATVAGRHLAFASENGHANFAPATEEEFRFTAYLKRSFPVSVSAERVLCGPGIISIYRFLAEENPALASKEVLAEIADTDSAAPIADRGLTGEDPLCARALDFFLRALGSRSADLVLTFLATGGVYLGGGVPPKLLPRIKNGAFMSGFLEKQRLVEVIERCPVFVIKDDQVALLGAASLALEAFCEK